MTFSFDETIYRSQFYVQRQITRSCGTSCCREWWMQRMPANARLWVWLVASCRLPGSWALTPQTLEALMMNNILQQLLKYSCPLITDGTHGSPELINHPRKRWRYKLHQQCAHGEKGVDQAHPSNPKSTSAFNQNHQTSAQWRISFPRKGRQLFHNASSFLKCWAHSMRRWSSSALHYVSSIAPFWNLLWMAANCWAKLHVSTLPVNGCPPRLVGWCFCCSFSALFSQSAVSMFKLMLHKSLSWQRQRSINCMMSQRKWIPKMEVPQLKTIVAVDRLL